MVLGLALTMAACADLLGLDELDFSGRNPKVPNSGSAGGEGGNPDNGGDGGTNASGGNGASTGAGGMEGGEGGVTGGGGSAGSGGATAGRGGAAGASGSEAGGQSTGGGGSGNASGATSGGSSGASGDSGSGGGAGSGGSGAGDGGAGGNSGSGGGSSGPTVIPLPAGYQAYCSMRAPNGLESELSWDEAPCEAIMQRTGWSETQIDRAGYFDMTDSSFSVMRCASNVRAYWIGTPGYFALIAARNEALNGNHSACVFNASPLDLPVFSAPFSIHPLPAGFQMSNTGYDFATLPGSPAGSEPRMTLDVRLYSQTSRTPNSCSPPSTGCSTVVSYRGQDRSNSADDNEQGFTWAMNADTPVLAMGEGQVVAKRARRVTGCFTAQQNELYVRHVVGTSLDSRYAEIFIAYYAHLHFAAGIDVGSAVTRGQVIGYVGNSGCTGGRNQLHLAVLRGSNTAREYHPSLDTAPGIYGANGDAPDNSVARIDPWGWQASQAQWNIDPGGYAWYNSQIPDMGPGGAVRVGGGAFSIALFKVGQAPPRPCDEDDRDWTIAGGGTLKNPFAHCNP